MWDEAVRLFTQGMPRKRHRIHMRHYEDSFTGSEAIKWFYQALLVNPHFNAVITQDKTHQLLNKFFEEGIFVKVRDSGRTGSEHFKLHGIYQMSQSKPRYTARTPLSTKCMLNHNQRGENWIRRSLQKQPFMDFDGTQAVTGQILKNYDDEDPSVHMHPHFTKAAFGHSAFKNSQVCDKQCRCGSLKSCRVVQHPVQQRKQYQQKEAQSFSPSHLDDIWREVFLERLQGILQDLDVSGLLWPFAIIRCQWLEYNCCILEDNSAAKFPPWVKASSSRLMHALVDKNLNRSIVNLDIEADVSAMEAFFGNLHTTLIPADLCAVFLRVFLHLEVTAAPSLYDHSPAMEIDGVSVSSDVSSDSTMSECTKSRLPPNTCFETAFTSESPITRIVPQCSFDTLHLRSAFEHTPMKRNMSAPKLLEAGLPNEAEEVSFKKSTLSQRSLTGLGDTVKCSTLSGTSWESKRKQIRELSVNSLPRKGIFRKAESPKCQTLRKEGGSDMHHSCGQLKVTDKTPPLHPNKYHSGGSGQRKLQEKHSRSQSGGYVNLALQDSFESLNVKNGELDLEAAMESLQKLMVCSQPAGPHNSPGKRTTQHVRSASLSSPQDLMKMPSGQKNLSCWSQDLSLSSCQNEGSSFCDHDSSRLGSAKSRVHSLPSLTAGCEWGWDWGSEAEKSGVSVFRLLMLLLPPQSRAQLQLLLKLMGLLPFQCPYTTIKVLEMFSSSIIPNGDEDVTARFLGFMVRHHEEIFIPPEKLLADVQRFRKTRIRPKERAAVTFCERVSLLQFEEQKLTTSQKALMELLDQIIADQKMGPKEKSRKLKMFKEAYPHIYSIKFPCESQKNRHRSILQLARLRSLRV